MPISPIPINKGVFKTQTPRALKNAEFAEDLINLFVGQGGENFDRPSLSALAELDSITVIGAAYFDNVLVFVTQDRKVYTMNLSGSSITDVTGAELPGTSRPVFTNDGQYLYIVGGGAPIKWGGAGTVTAALGGSPPDMTHIVWMDGYLIGNRRLAAENNKVIQYCNFETPETWTGTNIFSAVADPDPLQALEVSQRELYAVGEKTTEVWQNIGSSPVPFARAYVWQYGTIAPYSVHAVDNALFMLDQDRRILKISGRQVERLSEGIENDIFSYETVTDCWSRSFTWKGSIHVLFVFPTAQKAWSIDLKNNQWTEWVGFDGGIARLRLHSLVYVPSTGQVFGGDWQTGSIWSFSDTDKTDAGGIFLRQRTFSYRDGGVSVRKRANYFRVDMERNIASAYSGTTSETNPILELRWRDEEDGWSSWRRSEVGRKGEGRFHMTFYRAGIFRLRKYQLRMTDPAEFNMIGVETDETVMTT